MPTFHNKTRTSTSIPRRLVKEGKFYLVPLYYLLKTSYLAHEGVTNSGSYAFADHVYAGKPKGKYVIGMLFDWIFLNMVSARSMRARYVYAKRQIRSCIHHSSQKKRVDILAVPSGLGREVFEMAEEIEKSDSKETDRVHWHLMDLDPQLIPHLKKKARSLSLQLTCIHGDALNERHYEKRRKYDLIISAGFIDFLDDANAEKFLKILKKRLKPGGKILTSGMKRHALSDFLLRTFGELHTQYRTDDQLMALVKRCGFDRIRRYKEMLLTVVVLE